MIFLLEKRLRNAVNKHKFQQYLEYFNLTNTDHRFPNQALLYKHAFKRSVFHCEDQSDWADSAVNSSGANAPHERPCGLIQSLIRSSLRSQANASSLMTRQPTHSQSVKHVGHSKQQSRRMSAGLY